MRDFHVRIHGRPEPRRRDGVSTGPSCGPLSVDFETVLARLAQEPRLYAEPDGSFVWRCDSQGRSWQVDGQLVDAGETLASVELRGCCPSLAFGWLLEVLGGPLETRTIELVSEGVFMDKAEFVRRLASEEETSV